MGLFRKRNEEQLAGPEMVDSGLNLTMTECCGPVLNDKGVGARLFYLASEQELVNTPNPAVAIEGH